MRCSGRRRARRPRARAALAAALGFLPAACGGGGGSDGASEGIVLSGSIFAAGSTAADSDVNVGSAPYAPNDTPASAQRLPNPVTAGGYVNVAENGPNGRSWDEGDPIDLYRVALATGQVIRLVIAERVESGAPDLDLRLLDTSGVEIAVSDGSGQSEEITVSEPSGEFLVEVSAVAGFSNYVLTIGQAPTSTALGAAALPAEPAPRQEFVPGEVIVLYRESQLGPSAARTPEQRASHVGMRHVRGRRGGPLLFRVGDAAQRYQAFHALGIEHLWREEARRSAALDPEEQLRQDTRRLAKALRRQPDVAAASLNYIRRPAATPDDEFYPFQWHYDLINLPQAWDAVTADSGVIVAVLDTGIRPAHPDLSGQLVAGYDLISDPDRANDGDGCDDNPFDDGDGSTPGGNSYHGTHVAGTVAAHTSLQPAGDTGGVAGVAWNARIMPLRVLGRGGGTDADIMAAIRYAVGLDNACIDTASSRARVINMSLGGPGHNEVFEALIDQIRADDLLDDTIFVAAAGNSSSTTPSYPAAYDGVISVSAVGPTKSLAPYSSFGSTVSVAAPGGDFTRDVNGDGFPDGVLSTHYDLQSDRPTYAFAQGTSMAAPHVAGVVALMLGVNPAINAADLDNLLNVGQITEDIGDPNFFGNGLIDAVKAVNAAAELENAGSSPVVDPVLRVSPDALNFGLLASSFDLTVGNGGGSGSSLEVTDVSFTSDDGGSWLAWLGYDVDADGLGSYFVAVGREGLADGIYTGTLTFESNANDVAVPVIMEVGDPLDAQSDAGHHFVLLVEEGTLDTVAVVEADPVNGAYAYRFENVMPGRYQIIAGTDSDNDLFICDPGEACGAYPTLGTTVTIEVEESMSGLDFGTGFEARIGALSDGPEDGFRRASQRRLMR